MIKKKLNSKIKRLKKKIEDKSDSETDSDTETDSDIDENSFQVFDSKNGLFSIKDINSKKNPFSNCNCKIYGCRGKKITKDCQKYQHLDVI